MTSVAAVGRWPLHGGGGIDLAVSWPVLLAIVAFWLVVGGTLYWYYGNRTAER